MNFTCYIRCFALLYFFVYLSKGYSQSEIHGKSVTYAGQIITLRTYSDMVSYTLEDIDSDTVKQDGTFVLKSNRKFVYSGFIDTDNARAQLYIEPQKQYHISYIPPNEKSPELSGSKKEAGIIIENEDTTGLNYKISKFYGQYDAFMVKNYASFITKSAGSVIDSFELKINTEFSKDSTIYFLNVVDYTLASLQLTALKSKAMLYEKYIDSKPVLYSHEAYMTFINQFYNQFFSSIKMKNQNALYEKITVSKNIEEILEILGREPFLKNEQIRELVLIMGLYESCNNSDYNKESNLFLLRNLKDNSTQLEHRAIAANLIEKLTRFSKGNKAPDFILRDQNDSILSLSTLRGKYVYLDFWASWCTPCLKEMKLTEELHKKYGDKIHFVSISIDNDKESMLKFLNKNPSYKWMFLHYESQRSIKDDYNVRGIPMYYLIDPEGYFYTSPTLRPSEGIETLFEKISGKQKKNSPRFLLETE